jgi:S1-C subfamily serine protease
MSQRRSPVRRYVILLLPLLLCVSAATAPARAQERKPISKRGLLEALRLGGLTTGELVRHVRTRGVNFRLSPEDEDEFRRVGARPELIAAVRESYRAAPAAPASPAPEKSAPPPPSEKSPPAPETPRVSLGLLAQDVTPQLAASRRLAEVRGVFVDDVVLEGAADRAGLETGDVIVAFDAMPIDGLTGLRRELSHAQPGQSVTLTLIREGRERTARLTFDAAPRAPAEGGPNGRFGLFLSPLTPEFASRFGVTGDLLQPVVTDLDTGGTAAAAGLRVGDLIAEVNGLSVRSVEEAKAALLRAGHGRSPFPVVVLRRWQRLTLTLPPFAARP